MSDKNSQDLQLENRFKSLLGYGKFLSGLGWVILIIGILLLVFSILLLSDSSGRSEALINMGGLLLSLVLSLSGISMVIFGQTVSCFVAIEKNTRATYEMFKSQKEVVEQDELNRTDNDQTNEGDMSEDNSFT